MSRVANVHRKTKETDIAVELNLDGSGQSKIFIGVPFLEHMLELFAKHGLFDLKIDCKGDLEIDDHHSVEDIAITLGQALVQALGDKSGINRYGEAVVPMDEALCRSVIDLSGRFYLVYEVQTRRQMIGNFSVELAEHFLALVSGNCEVQSSHRLPARAKHSSHSRGNVQSVGARVAPGGRTKQSHHRHSEYEGFVVNESGRNY